MTPTTPKLSPTQWALLGYFAGRGHDQTLKPVQATYDSLIRAGLIEPVDEFPFHRATAVGLAALGSRPVQ